MKKIFILLLLFLPSTGCGITELGMVGGAASAAIQGYIMWKQGEATKYYFADEDVLYRAVEKSAKDLELPVVKDGTNKKGKGYHVTVGQKDKFKIEVVQVEKNISKVSIRINVMGNKSYAELFYKTIDDNLNIIEFENGVPLNLKKKEPSSPQKEEPKLRRRLLRSRPNR